jgi:hypothetical protein
MGVNSSKLKSGLRSHHNNEVSALRTLHAMESDNPRCAAADSQQPMASASLPRSTNGNSHGKCDTSTPTGGSERRDTVGHATAVDRIPPGVAKAALEVVNPTMAPSDDEAFATEGLTSSSSGTDEEDREVLRNPDHPSHGMLVKQRKRIHRGKKKRQQLTLQMKATKEGFDRHVGNLTRQLSTTKKESAANVEAVTNANETVVQLRKLIASGQTAGTEGSTSAVNVWEALKDGYMKTYDRLTKSSSPATSESSFRLVPAKVEQWDGELPDLPEDMKQTTAAWTFANLDQGKIKNEDGIKVAALVYINTVISALKCLDNNTENKNTKGMSINVEVATPATEVTTAVGLRVDICVHVDEKVVLPIEVKVTGSWAHMWEQFPMEENEELRGPIPLEVLWAMEPASINHTVKKKKKNMPEQSSMIGPISQTFTYMVRHGTRYGIVTTGLHTYLLRRDGEGGMTLQAKRAVTYIPAAGGIAEEEEEGTPCLAQVLAKFLWLVLNDERSVGVEWTMSELAIAGNLLRQAKVSVERKQEVFEISRKVVKNVRGSKKEAKKKKRDEAQSALDQAVGDLEKLRKYHQGLLLAAESEVEGSDINADKGGSGSAADDEGSDTAGKGLRGKGKSSRGGKSNNSPRRGTGNNGGDNADDEGSSNTAGKGGSRGKVSKHRTTRAGAVAKNMTEFIPSGRDRRRDVALGLELDFSVPRTMIAGEFRTGPAYRTTLRGNALVVKIANTYKDRYLRSEVQNEERVFDKLEDVQGDVVPRLVYAGQMFGGRHAIATSDCGQTIDVWAETAAPDALAAVGAQARAKLRKLHQVGVLHKDIKAGNITVDSNNTVRFIDLAFARDLHDPDSPEAVGERAVLDMELRGIGA